MSQTPFTYTTSGSLVGEEWTITVTVQPNGNPAYAISLTDSNDVFIAGAIAQTLIYKTSTPGNYTVTISGPSGCIYTEDITLE